MRHIQSHCGYILIYLSIVKFSKELTSFSTTLTNSNPAISECDKLVIRNIGSSGDFTWTPHFQGKGSIENEKLESAYHCQGPISSILHMNAMLKIIKETPGSRQ